MYLLYIELAEFECEREEVKKLEERLTEVEETLAKKQEEKKGKFNIMAKYHTLSHMLLWSMSVRTYSA